MPLRLLSALLPQHDNPWSYDLAEETAFTPYGASTAAAILTCVLFFLFLLCAIANSMYTRYIIYEVLCASTACVWLAFNNGGVGANAATLSLVLGTWLHKVGPAFFGKMERRMYALWAYTLVAAVVTFGAGCGAVAAALTFGAYEHYAASYGQRLRTAASYMLLSGRIAFSVLVTQRSKSGFVPASEDCSAKQPRLVILILVCDCLLAIRAAAGVVALYSPYQHLWINDLSYYLLDTLPELLALCILVTPTMLARIAQVYPKPPKRQQNSKQDSKGTSKSSKQDSEGTSKGRLNKQQKDSAHSKGSTNNGSPGTSTSSHNLIGTKVVFDSAQEAV